MARVRVIGLAEGVVRHDEGDALTPLIPSALQFNAEEGELEVGELAEIRVLVRVEAIVPVPLPESA